MYKIKTYNVSGGVRSIILTEDIIDKADNLTTIGFQIVQSQEINGLGKDEIIVVIA